jgi:replicative DNA helicase
MTKAEFDPTTAVYTPPEVSQYAIDAIREVKGKATRGIAMPIALIRDYFAPVLPGQVTVVQAQTSQYKSGFLHFWEKHAAQQLMDDKRFDEAIIHVSVEECVEEQGFLMLARMTGETAGDLARGKVQDWSKLEQAAAKIGTIPIYRIGDSLARAEDMPNLYLSNMYRAINELVSGRVTGTPIKPALITFDYLQAFPIDPEVGKAEIKDRRNLQVREDFYRLRQLAGYFKCPVVVAVQAKQELEQKNINGPRMPGMYDAQDSSAIAQRADRIISLWMPKVTYPVGSFIEINGTKMKVEENMIFVKVNKQRGGLPSGQSWLCRVDFSQNEIAPDTGG